MQEDASEKDGVDDAIAGGPVPVLGDDDDGQEHEAEAVVDAAEAADQAERVAVPDEEGERVPRRGRGEVVRPPVETAGCGHAAAQIRHRYSNDEDEHAGEEPALVVIKRMEGGGGQETVLRV